MKSFKLHSIAGMCLCILSFGTHLHAQVTFTKIYYNAPKIVNFTQLAQYERIHPVVLPPRFVEQGEDKDKNFKFIPGIVPSDAITVKVNPPTQLPPVTSPAPTTTFNGVLDNGTLIPPDIRGAVGPNYVMETTNQQFNIYTKSGTLNSTLTITTFFSATGGSGYYDPHVVYDPVNSRFIVGMDGSASNGHSGLFLAVSQTSDPTGSWYVYSIDATGNANDFLDYPLLGYNTNWIILTGNDFINGSSPVYAKIYVFNRASLYSGTSGYLTAFTNQSAFTIAPAQTFDASQTTEYLVHDYNGNSGGSGYVQIGTITGSVTSPSYNAGTTLGVTSPWSETAIGAKQQGNSNTIEDGDTRIGNAVYINGSLWFCHNVFLPASSPTYTGVDWWQVNPSSNTVQQYGRIATSGVFNYYPSIAVNTNGDALLGYCQSSTTEYASAVYSFHASGDAANTMETGYLYKSGVAGYYKTYGGGRNRWGDFTGSAVDPLDNSFWNFSEWANTSNNWGTTIAHIPASSGTSCSAPTGMSTSNIGNNSATFSWTAVSGAASYNVQYRAVGTSTWTSANTTSTSYNASGLTAGTNYEWQVQTVCSGGGTSSFTASTNFTTTGTQPCNAPTGMATSSITSSSATFSWSAVSGATSYNVQYRQVGTSTWTSASTSSTSYNATGLTTSTNYEWQVQTVCSGGGTSSFTASTNFSTTGITYCSSVGMNLDGITNVTFNTINNNSSGTSSGYTDYTATISTTVNQNSSYTLSAKINTGGNYTNYTKAWIDWNHDGVFSTTTEEYNLGTATNVTNGSTSLSPVTVVVPSNAVIGTTRMRVSTQYNGNPTPCNASFDGEVEDYSVVVAAGNGCNAPGGLAAGSITNTSATLSWSPVSGANSYNLQWKATSSGTWTTVSSLTSTSYNLSGLTAGTSYQFQVQSVCSGGNSGYSSPVSFTTTGGTIIYCASKGNSTTYEYINKVALGSINNTSGDNKGYGNYTNLSTNLAAGTANTITLTPGFHGSSYTEYWTVYIDYNQNGVLNDAGETVATGSGSAAISKSFTVPTTAKNGSTRMRIQMHYGSSSTNPCATLDYGEVEDYTVNITGGTRLESSGSGNTQLTLYPNPTTGLVNVEFIQSSGEQRIEVVSLTGSVLLFYNAAANETIAHLDVSNLPAGIYLVRELMTDGSVSTSKLVKE